MDRVVTELGIGDSRELLRLEWGPSQQAMPGGSLTFLSTGFVREACEGLYFPDELAEDAVAAARRVAANPTLSALAWHCHWCLYHCEDYPNRVADRWPSLEGVLQDMAGMFYLLVLLSWFPEMRAIHRAHSVPERVVRDSMNQIYQRGLTCSEMFGRWGLDGVAARWLSTYLRGEIYALGRLVHHFRVLDDPLCRFRVYRRTDSSMVIALSEDGVSYRVDGQIWREEDAGTEAAWTSRLEVTEKEITGNPILPTGCAVEREVCLPAAEWSQVLAQGDPVLYFHIPGGIPLDHAQCGASFQEAMEFFPRYFPERPFKAFYCGTWLLDTQLEAWLPPTANLVRFLQEFYLCPGGNPPESMLRTVLGDVPEDLSLAPRKTTLQRAILDHLSGGNRMVACAGRGTLFPEDFEWGMQVYRRARFPWYLMD